MFLVVAACGKPEPDVATPVDDFRSFQVPPGSKVRIQISPLTADVEATSHLTCAGKRIRSWKHAGLIEFTLTESCNLDWTLAGSGPPREMKFMVHTARAARSMTFTTSTKPMRLTWVFNVAR